MNNELQTKLIHAIFRFKRLGLCFPPVNDAHPDLNMGEIVLMGSIAHGAFEDVGPKLHEVLCVTKPAISQMLGALERKGYILRDINKDNRRRIVLTLTEKGRVLVAEGEAHIGSLFTDIINRFGEEDARQLIALTNRFADITESMRGAEAIQSD